MALLLAACARPPKPPIEDLSGREDLSSFKVSGMRGTRDGDHLDAEATFSDGSSVLRVQMRFNVGVPTKLGSGRWHWTRDAGVTDGTVAERSVIFLRSWSRDDKGVGPGGRGSGLVATEAKTLTDEALPPGNQNGVGSGRRAAEVPRYWGGTVPDPWASR